MRDKNEDIHVFIIEEERRRNREQALREQALREKLQEPSEELVKALQGSSAVPEERAEKEAASASEDNRSTGAVVEDVEIGNCWMKPMEVGSVGFRIDARAVAVATAVYAYTLISAVVILWLNVVVTQDFPAFGLRFSLEWATPYRILMVTALGMSGLTAIAELFQIYVLARKSREKGVDEEWKTFALPDGSAIRVKTLVREVIQLNKHGHDGKPIYALKADNLVEVLELSEIP